MSEKKTKQRDNFENRWKTLVELSGEDNPERLPKIPISKVTGVFEEIARERRIKAEEVFKTKITGILEAKIKLDETLKKGREELVKKEEEQYQTLNNELEAAFRMLESVKNDNRDMLKAASGNFSKDNQEEEEQDNP